MNEIKGIVSGNEVDISKVTMIVNGVDKGWEVRTQNGDILWAADRTLIGTDTIQMKGYGLPLKSVRIKGNTQQTGTPSPQSIIMPDFCGVRTGNLVFKRLDSCNIGPTGMLLSNPEYNMFVAKVMQGQTYTADRSFLGGFFTSEPVVGSTSYDRERQVTQYPSFTAPIDGYVAFRKTASDTTAMLNTGSTALPYEPYGYKVPLTNAGQTTPVYLGQVQTVRRIKKLVLTGDDGFGAAGGGFYLGTIVPDYKRAQGQSLAVCTHYPTSPQPGAIQNVPDMSVSFSYGTTQRLYVKDSSFGGSLTAFTAYLAAQYSAGTPVTIWYVLATPVTGIVNEPLAKIGDYADELHIGSEVTIPTAVGTNILTVDTSLAPSRTEITGHVK